MLTTVALLRSCEQVFDTRRMASPPQKIKNGEHGPASAMRKILDPPIAVTAKIKWIDDGEEIINTVAVAWHHRSVEVVLDDHRRNGITVWIPANDVQRR